ncbi:MAG: hypothetical protein Q9185_006503, partial [Variospora sp. 1 TL-2023]
MSTMSQHLELERQDILTSTYYSGPTLNLRGGRAPPSSTTSLRPCRLQTAILIVQSGEFHRLTRLELDALRASAELPPVEGLSDEEVRALCAEAEDWVGMEYERRLRAEIDHWNEIRVLRAEDRRAGESLRWTAQMARLRGEGGLVSPALV